MKTLKLLLATVTAGLLLMASRCEEEDTNTLPPETQEGKHTFGCLIDGKVFTGFRKPVYFGQDPLAAYYSRSSKILSIFAEKYDARIGIVVYYPQENESKAMDQAWYVLRDKEELCPLFKSRNIGEIVLTRFDTINLIVSGRFHFIRECFDPIDGSTGYITDGRFDIRLMIFEN